MRNKTVKSNGKQYSVNVTSNAPSEKAIAELKQSLMKVLNKL